jgi:hypothetical protein
MLSYHKNFRALALRFAFIFELAICQYLDTSKPLEFMDHRMDLHCI